MGEFVWCRIRLDLGVEEWCLMKAGPRGGGVCYCVMKAGPRGGGVCYCVRN